MSFRSGLLVNKTTFKPQKSGDLLVCIGEDYFPITRFHVMACRSDAEYARKENRELRTYMRGSIEIALPQPKVFYRAKSPNWPKNEEKEVFLTYLKESLSARNISFFAYGETDVRRLQKLFSGWLAKQNKFRAFEIETLKHQLKFGISGETTKPKNNRILSLLHTQSELTQRLIDNHMDILGYARTEKRDRVKYDPSDKEEVFQFAVVLQESLSDLENLKLSAEKLLSFAKELSDPKKANALRKELLSTNVLRSMRLVREYLLDKKAIFRDKQPEDRDRPTEFQENTVETPDNKVLWLDLTDLNGLGKIALQEGINKRAGAAWLVLSPKERLLLLNTRFEDKEEYSGKYWYSYGYILFPEEEGNVIVEENKSLLSCSHKKGDNTIAETDLSKPVSKSRSPKTTALFGTKVDRIGWPIHEISCTRFYITLLFHYWARTGSKSTPDVLVNLLKAHIEKIKVTHNCFKEISEEVETVYDKFYVLLHSSDHKAISKAKE